LCGVAFLKILIGNSYTTRMRIKLKVIREENGLLTKSKEKE
jgi:hypothetical protein